MHRECISNQLVFYGSWIKIYDLCGSGRALEALNGSSNPKNFKAVDKLGNLFDLVHMDGARV